MAASMKERHAKIIEIMERQKVISIKQLAQKLQCTEMTIRRNLDELQEMNFVKRERGYAIMLKDAAPTDFFEQTEENVTEKEAIASAALTFIQPYQNICIDSGTTVQRLAEMLPANLPLSVITPSLMVALSLSNKNQVQLYMPAGYMHHSNRTLLIAEQESLASFRADIAFLSCRSLRFPLGTFEHSTTLIDTKRTLASIAEKRILLMDYSKWGVNSLCNAVKMEELDVIISDTGAPEEYVMQVAGTGKEIILVNPQTQNIEAHYNEPEGD